MDPSHSEDSKIPFTSEEEYMCLQKIFQHSIPFFEAQKLYYAKKVRVRRTLPHLLKDDPKEVALGYFNKVLKAKLKHRDIVKAKRMKPWLGTGQDIVVTFRNEEVRNRVYNLRTLFNGGLFFVCDELFEERILIWKVLLNKYGETNVITRDGAVYLRQGGNEFKFVTVNTLKEYLGSLNAVSCMEKDLEESCSQN